MPEKFKEFKQICQGAKLEKQKRKKDWWHAVPRFISIYITWILVKTPITANIVTIVGIIIGLTGLYLIFLGGNFTIILGFILIYLYYITDEIDGEIARYKKQTSVKGIYYDEIGHLLFQGSLFLIFGFHLYNITSNNLYIILGFLSSFFLLCIRAVRKICFVATSKSSVEKIENKEHITPQENQSIKGGLKLFKRIIINLINGFSHTMLITTLFFIGYLLYIYFELLWILELLLKTYVFFLLIVFIAFTITKYRSIEKDVISIYNSVNQ